MAAPPHRAEQEERLAACMLAAQQGDAAAYTSLLEEISKLARSFISRRSDDSDSGEDFVQEVLISLHRARRSYNPSRPFLPWMWAILRRRYIDFVRRYVRQIAFQGPSGYAMESIPAAEAPDHGKRAALIDAALARLPPSQRGAVELTKLKGLSVREAAKRLGTSEAALRVTVHRARANLFKILSQMGYEDS